METSLTDPLVACSEVSMETQTFEPNNTKKVNSLSNHDRGREVEGKSGRGRGGGTGKGPVGRRRRGHIMQ